MKFSSKIIFTLVNAAVALAAINDKQQHDDTFNFWVSGPSGGTATLVSLRKNPTSAKSLTIPAAVYVEGYKYKVTGVLDHSFSGSSCPFEDITVSSGVEEFHFDHYSFNNCNNLKRVTLSNNVITAELTAFKDVNNKVSFRGKGTKSFVNDYVPKLHRSLSLPTINYRTANNDQKKEALYNIAKSLKNYLKNSNINDSGNVAVNLVTKFGTSDGYARLFRLLAIAAGYPEADILVGGDNNGHYWNYVALGYYWWNCDINYNFRSYSTYQISEQRKPLFLRNAEFKQRLNENYSINVDPKNFYVYFSNYGYPDEFRGQQSYDKFDNYVNQGHGYRW